MVYTTVYTIHAGALETITIDGVYGSFITNSDGNVNHALPLGELTLHGSVSGQSFTRTVTKDTTDVYVMPEGALYWYGTVIIDWNFAYSDDSQLSTYPFFNTNTSGEYATNHVLLPYVAGKSQIIISKNMVDFADHNRLNMLYDCIYSSNNKHSGQLTHSNDSTKLLADDYITIEQYVSVKDNILSTIDITSYRSTSRYVYARAYITTMNIKAIWLE